MSGCSFFPCSVSLDVFTDVFVFSFCACFITLSRMLQVSQAVTVDYPDLVLPTGLEVIAGLLYVPLSSGGKDFIALLRKGQMRDVHWAGRPYKVGVG